MLFLPPGTARVQRLHGAYVSDADVHRVVDFIKRQEEPRYEMELLEGGDGDEAEGEDGEDLSDEMYDMAVRLVTEHRQASISWLQRRLRVGSVAACVQVGGHRVSCRRATLRQCTGDRTVCSPSPFPTTSTTTTLPRSGGVELIASNVETRYEIGFSVPAPGAEFVTLDVTI